MIHKSKIEAPQQEQKTVETESEESNRVLEEMESEPVAHCKWQYEKYWKVIDESTCSNPPKEVSKYNTSFVVTAYYSPKPWQSKYSTGSYPWDIKLNWEWTHGANWVAVFDWMIAAPSKYAFGTKIELEWLWTFEVQDRGGAIVPAGQRWYSYDRIDIWMGEWDEGLQKALNFWKQTIRGNLINN